MVVVLALLLASMLGFLATAIYLPLARHLTWLDTPEQRSSHRIPTPSSGGLALVTAMLVSMGLLSYSGYLDLEAREFQTLGAVLLLCLLGAWDDRSPLSVRGRLAIQFVIAGGVLWSYDVLALYGFVAVVLLVGLVWLVNLYNFMDGIDGIAALQCVLTAVALAGLGHLAGADENFQVAAAVVAGVYLGFLFFNRPPAKLFMGDAGSLTAGLLLGWLGLWSWLDGVVSPASWLLLMSPFLLDTGVTLVRRMARGEALGEAHKGHLYQRLSRHWGGAGRVDGALLLLHACWLLPLALAATLAWAAPWTLLALGLFPQLVLMAKCRALE